MRRIVVVLALAFALMAPASAFADSSSTCQAYNTQAVCTSTTSTLPFTGVNVVLLTAVGCAMLCTGFFVRRLSRRQS
jgi:hypothetical protein